MLMDRVKPRVVPVDPDNPAIVKNHDLCSKCGHCYETCESEIGVAAKFRFGTDDTYKCIHCGQCAASCPEQALTGKSQYQIVRTLVKDPTKVVVFSTSPSVRVGFADGFGMEPGTFSQDQMVGALRRLGADFVFDVTFSADLTIMEEGSELLRRVTTGQGVLPQFTSCCPAWVKYMEYFHPDKLAHLSSAKSPIGMQGAIIKGYFAALKRIDPRKIVNVAVTPCTAKKFEITREELCDAGKFLGLQETMRDNDYVITTRELVQWCREEGLKLEDIQPSKFDSVLGEGTGAGMIFGNTGGVMEAALRAAYTLVEKKQPPADFFRLQPVRGLANRKVAEVTIGGVRLKACVLYGTAEAERFLSEDMSGYHFVEVMTCPGGCIGGAGQPNCGVTPVPDDVRAKRIASLYAADERAERRNSIDNPEITDLYEKFLGEPLSERAEQLLHTTYHAR
ncbi:MAG: iron hydrogenase small subunit [Clostridiales bacterium]|nr:iron hydrogenase small subunit [Clostridiales bacterium]